jgi:hypothetical protein
MLDRMIRAIQMVWGFLRPVVFVANAVLNVWRREAYPMAMPNLPANVVGNCTFDLYRPFSSGTPLLSNQVGSLVDDFPCGRSVGGSNFIFTHTLYVDAALDIRDGAFRGVGGNVLYYNDGDKIVVTFLHQVITYVVVFVGTAFDVGSGGSLYVGSKAVWLMRDNNAHV